MFTSLNNKIASLKLTSKSSESNSAISNFMHDKSSSSNHNKYQSQNRNLIKNTSQSIDPFDTLKSVAAPSYESKIIKEKGSTQKLPELEKSSLHLAYKLLGRFVLFQA